MYICNNEDYHVAIEECNTVREPVCGRGGLVTAYSVQGTGPGMACKITEETVVPPTTPPRAVCKIGIVTNNRISYISSGSKGITVC